MTSKFHELLAVEGSVRQKTEAVLTETLNTFQSKESHFKGHTRRYNPRDDEGEKFPDEDQYLTTTVPEKLEYTTKQVIEGFDVILQKEECNSRAKADLVLDGVVFKKDMPSTALLTYEHKLLHLKEIWLKIPTLEPGENWERDTHRAHVYHTAPKFTLKTKKMLKPVVLHPGTDKHPPQVQAVNEDEVIGKWEQINFSGKISPIEKSEILERLDKMIAAVKKARCRANEVDVSNWQVGSLIFNYINKGILPTSA